MTYSPYTSSGACKAKDDVASDIATIAKAGFTTVRVYSTDCSSLEFIGPACAANGLKMILGVFINGSGISAAQPQVDAIAAWAQWNLVELIIIGNEAVFSGYCSASELAAFISSSKAAFAATGYTGPCTTTEPLSTWQQSTGALCGVVDIVGCNIHPFFNGAVDAASAGSFVAGQLAIVDSLCPGKTGINCETGWPSAGKCNNAACPGTVEQATAVASIKNAVGGKSVMFSYVDDLWKVPGDYGCEQSWGAIHLFL
jgi:exo-beta-1,3-glucanase (GH17 family)